MKLVPLVLAGLLALTVSAGAMPADAGAPGRHAPAADRSDRSDRSGSDDLRNPGEPRGGPSDEDVQRGALPRDAHGTDTIVVLRAYWTQPDAATEADVDQSFAASDAWFNEVSHGQFRITATSSPDWVQIAPSDCNDVDQVTKRAVAAQRKLTPSFDPGVYDHVITYIPYDGACEGFAGRGSLPGRRIVLYGPRPNIDTSLSVRTITHELGHNLGLSHSMSLACKAADGSPATLGTRCARPVEYGDTTDNMGGSQYRFPAGSGPSVVPAYSASQQAKLGWLGHRLQKVSPCQDVTLSPYEGTDGTTAVRVSGGEGITYWLEYRHPAAGTVDEGLPATLRDGAVLHLTTSKSPSPFLLDGRPDAAGNMDDAAIPVGGVVPTREGFSISTLAAGATSTVRISTARPTAPLRVRARAIPGGTFITWGKPPCAGSSPISGYRLAYRVQGSKSWHPVTTARGTRHSFRIGLPGRRKFLIRVTAVNAAGPSVRSSTSNFVRPLGPLARLRVKGPRRIVAGGVATQVVTLVSPRTHRRLAGIPMTLQKRSIGKPWRNTKSVKTGHTGIASVKARPLTNTLYRWVFRGSRSISRTTSRPVRVAVAPKIGLVRTKRVVHRSGTVTFAGTLLPQRPGQRILLQAKSGKRWVTVKITRTVRKKLPHGRHVIRYRLALRFPLVGSFRLRAITRPSRTNAAGISHVVTVRVTGH